MRHCIIICLLLLGAGTKASAGKKLKVLFIGNSYTYVNNMPQIVADIATSTGDTLVWDMAAPGGATFYDHCTDPVTLSKIGAGGWDYVALQEQSQTPALPDAIIQGKFPHARQLDSQISVFSPCAATLFYMTWGRKNGDASNCNFYTVQYNWPWYCTYAGMDSVIRLRYRMMADSNKAGVSPAGAVWHYIRGAYPGIELYDADESHPSAAGSYAVACAFYVALFKADPTLTNYDYTLSGTIAANIRQAAKKVVYDSMSYWHIGQYRTEAAFTVTQTGSSLSFKNASLGAMSYRWYFGDGQSDNATNPVHNYGKPGTYNVMLVASGSTGCSDTSYETILVKTTGIKQASISLAGIKVSPNPCRGTFVIDLPEEETDLAVVDMYGHTVFSKRASGRTMVDIQGWPAGVYGVRISIRGSVWNTRMTVY
jgi:hypothetical protein